MDPVLEKERTDRQIGSEHEGWQEPGVAADAVAKGQAGGGAVGPPCHIPGYCSEGKVGLREPNSRMSRIWTWNSQSLGREESKVKSWGVD